MKKPTLTERFLAKADEMDREGQRIRAEKKAERREPRRRRRGLFIGGWWS